MPSPPAAAFGFRADGHGGGGYRDAMSGQVQRTHEDEKVRRSTRRHEPRDIPPRGWLQVMKEAWKQSQSHQLSLLSAGVAFYAFMALFPAMIAAVLLYGLIANPADVQRQVTHLSGTLPSGAINLLTTQLKAVTTTSHASLGFGLVISLLLALWSASGGVSHVVATLNVAYELHEGRNWIKRKALALGLTAAAITFAAVALALTTVRPHLLDHLAADSPLLWLLESARWVALVLAMMAALAVLYRVAPDHTVPIRWVSPGAALATVIWLIASIGFSVYANQFGSYNKTYGALAGVVVLLTWLWLTIYLVLLGAAVNAEAEQQVSNNRPSHD